MNVAVFHPGTQHSWQTAMALQGLDRLAWYATSIFYQPERFPYRLERMVPGPVSRRLHAEFVRFSHPGLDPAKVRTSGLTEWLERIAARSGQRKLAKYLDTVGNRRFARALVKEIQSDDRFALWGYNGSSLDAFAAAAKHGRRTILDRTIGDFRYYNDRMAELQERYGDWFLPTERRMTDEHIARDQQEFELADTIVVGAEFAAQTIRDRAGSDVAKKVRVLHYCFDERLFANQPPPAPVPRNGPVKFLFIGQANPRKGIHHLLEAFGRLPASEAQLTVLGDMRVPPSTFARHAGRIDYIPTVARSQVPAIMAQHHVLVFPSYFEGSALSLMEGLASGLALIQTQMSGNGVTPQTGLMIERPDTELLEAAMVAAFSDRDRLDAWRGAAQAEARNYTFARYQENIAALLQDANI
ncbi:MAG: glycosyltransferase family 4 protein [Novosphingobium sp.]